MGKKRGKVTSKVPQNPLNRIITYRFLMLKAIFPPIKCINGHVHAYTDSECPQCHESARVSDEDSFCQKCSMIRPTIIETTTTKTTTYESSFCFWCGAFMSKLREEPMVNY